MKNTAERLLEVDWNFPNSSKANSLHNIHPYPAKFISEIPRHLIRILGVPEGSHVLDPFCGSGTTLVESQQAGYPSIGIDLHPIACLISRVKTQPLPQGLIGQATSIVVHSKSTSEEVAVPDIPNLNHWFPKDIQIAVTKLVKGIDEVEDLHAQEALRLALSSILVRVSNQDSDTRYAAVEKDLNQEDVYTEFASAVEKLSTRKWHLPIPLPEAKVYRQDILDTLPTQIGEPIGLVITSPPYPNAYEYWLYHKYRMFWLGYDPIEVKRKEIGARAHYFKKNHPTVDDFRSQMRQLFGLLWEVVVEGGKVCFIVGRSKIHGEIIDNAKLISEVAQSIGFEEIVKLPRQISSSRKSFNLSHASIKTEYLLVFDKC